MLKKTRVVKPEQIHLNQVKDVVDCGKPRSIMNRVGEQSMKRINRTVAAGAALLTTAATVAVSVPMMISPVQAQSQETVFQMADRLRPNYITLLTVPEFAGQTIRTDPPLYTGDRYFLRTDSTYWYTYMAGPGPLTIDILKYPNKDSSANVAYYSNESTLPCKDSLGGNFNRRGKCTLSRQQPVLMAISFTHNRGEPLPFSFRLRGFSGIIGPGDADLILARQRQAVKNVGRGPSGVIPSRKRFCSKINGRCW
jgi:hypothetical protein